MMKKPYPFSICEQCAGGGTSGMETDPTVPDWAKAETKPTYTAEEVGALPKHTVIPTKVSDLENDRGYAEVEYVDKKCLHTGSSTDTVDVTVSPYSKIFSKTTSTNFVQIPIEENDVEIEVISTPSPIKTFRVIGIGDPITVDASNILDLTQFNGVTKVNVNLTEAVTGKFEAVIRSNTTAISAEVKDGSITKQKLADKLVEELETHVIGEIVGDTSAQPAQASNDWATTNFDFTDNFDASQDGIYTGEGITYDANGINFPSDAFRAWRYRPASKHNGWSPLCISYNYAFGFKLDSGGILEQTAPMIWNNHRVYLSITETGVTVFNGGATNGASIAVTENENDFVPGNSWNDVLVVANGDTDGYHVYMKKKTDATFTHVAYAPTYREGGSWADTGFLLEAKGAKVSYAVSCKAVSQPSNEEVFPVSLMNAAGRVLAPYILKNVWKELLDRYYIWF